MRSNAYSEDQIIEQPPIGLFTEPGWQVAGRPISASCPA